MLDFFERLMFGAPTRRQGAASQRLVYMRADEYAAWMEITKSAIKAANELKDRATRAEAKAELLQEKLAVAESELRGDRHDH